MQIIEDLAKSLNMDREKLERESIKTYLEKELRNIEVEIYKIVAKHGVWSIFELDEKLKEGTLTEEEMRDDFMELDYLESKKDAILKAMGRIAW